MASANLYDGRTSAMAPAISIDGLTTAIDLRTTYAALPGLTTLVQVIRTTFDVDDKTTDHQETAVTHCATAVTFRFSPIAWAMRN